ncbi:MAG: hypothetical protein CMM76_12115 [Rhodospirillaceae bacterium]|nr:hypothetical protein [Rhodospirillaceae bacterium]
MTERAFFLTREGIALERQITEDLAPDLLQLDLTTQDIECSRKLLEDGIRSVLPAPTNPLHSIAHFHFRRFGKLLRGRTSLKVSEILGIESSTALNWALAVELMHNASLVHDDICDQDTSRHNHPTIFSAFGTPSAVCFGDWLVARSFELAIKSVSSEKGVFAIDSLAAAMRALSEGQSSEFNQVPVLNWSAYDEVVSKKTTPLLLAPIVGPLLMAGRKECLPSVRRVVCAVGRAYQMSNDILDAVGGDGNKMAFRDLERRAPNAVLVCFRNLLINGHQTAFDEWMSAHGQDDFSYWRKEVIESSALEICADRLKDQINICRQECDRLPGNLKASLEPLLDFLTNITRLIDSG